MFGLGGNEAHVDDPDDVIDEIPGDEMTDDQLDTVLANTALRRVRRRLSHLPNSERAMTSFWISLVPS